MQLLRGDVQIVHAGGQHRQRKSNIATPEKRTATLIVIKI